jgi:molybdopterin converting factor small subunit
MRINLRSNFVLPGLEDKESLDLDQSGLTLREFLEELSRRAPIGIEYARPGARALDPDEWEVEVNGVPYQSCSDGLETFLKDGDTVTIRILALGGG